MTMRSAILRMRADARRLCNISDHVDWVVINIDHSISKRYGYEKLECYINGFMERNRDNTNLPQFDFYTFETNYRSIVADVLKAVGECWDTLVRHNEEACYG